MTAARLRVQAAEAAVHEAREASRRAARSWPRPSTRSRAPRPGAQAGTAPAHPGPGPARPLGPGRPAAPRGRPRDQAAAPSPPRRPVSPAVVLLVVGAVLLLSAATVFVALSWQQLGVTGQALVLLGATAVAAVVSALLRRAGLRAATEATAAVTAGLVVLDLVGARTFDLLGLGGVDRGFYVATSALLVAAVSTLVVGVTMAAGAVSSPPSSPPAPPCRSPPRPPWSRSPRRCGR